MQSLNYFSFYLTNFLLIIFCPELIWIYTFQSDSLKQQTGLVTDSTVEKPINNYDNSNDFHLYKLLLNDFSDSALFTLQLDLLREQQNPLYYSQNTLSDQWKINGQLTEYFQFQRGVRLKSELGIFGKVLTYSKNLTAVILAILHIIKYKKGLY